MSLNLDADILADTDAIDPETEWKTWRAAPSPQNNARMLTALAPTIDRAASNHVGNVSPLIRGRARLMTLQALNTYNPSKGRLTSHVYNHLQGLKRYAARSSAAVQMPERVALDRRVIDNGHQHLLDELGRPPTDDELADHIGLSVRRIANVRRFSPAMATGGFSTMGEGGTPYDPAVAGDNSGHAAWLKVIRDDLHPVDQQIFDWTSQGMSNSDIARKLRLSPGAISQHKLKIQQLIDQEASLSPFGV